jgi:hypothetical protein
MLTDPPARSSLFHGTGKVLSGRSYPRRGLGFATRPSPYRPFTAQNSQGITTSAAPEDESPFEEIAQTVFLPSAARKLARKRPRVGKSTGADRLL